MDQPPAKKMKVLDSYESEEFNYEKQYLSDIKLYRGKEYRSSKGTDNWNV